MTKFAELELDEGIAARRYAMAVAAVEAARILGERKMLYLHEIVAPALPQEYAYPRRLLTISMTFLASMLAWLMAIIAMAFVRNYMA
jgi:capsular polysaccharide transport system permease protein